MSIWTESKHNSWIDNEGKYRLTIISRGNWYLNVDNARTNTRIVQVYLGLPNEAMAREYMANLLFVNQDSDFLVVNLKKTVESYRR